MRVVKEMKLEFKEGEFFEGIDSVYLPRQGFVRIVVLGVNIVPDITLDGGYQAQD